MSARVTQALVEVLSHTQAPARVTQAAAEVLSHTSAGVLVSQALAETLTHTHAGVLVTQVLAEVLRREGTPVPRCEPLPEWIAYGATGGPEWGTALFAAPGGWEQRPQMWPQVRGRWDIAFLNRTRGEIDTIVAFFRAVAQGRARSFCFTDWRDHTFDNDLATGDGVASSFQILKFYVSGTLGYVRPLSRPVVSSLVVTVNGVVVTGYAVDPVTGRLSFAAPPPSGAVIHASGEFEVLVRFESDTLQITCVAPGIFSCAGLGLVELIGE